MRNLEEALNKKGITRETVAALLNIHRNTLKNKLDGESDFTVPEAFSIKRNLLPEYDLDYLFEDALNLDTETTAPKSA